MYKSDYTWMEDPLSKRVKLGWFDFFSTAINIFIGFFVWFFQYFFMLDLWNEISIIK